MVGQKENIIAIPVNLIALTAPLKKYVRNAYDMAQFLSIHLR